MTKHTNKTIADEAKKIISEERMMNRQTKRKDKKNERGSALVLTLGILSLVLIMGMSFAFSSRTSRQVAKVNADQVKANLHGESGLDYVLGVMQEGFVETSGGETYPVLYPPTYKRPNTATDLEKRFVFSEHNMGFKIGSDKWAHQHIWSYVPADDDKADNSTDEEIPDEGDTKDVKKNGFDTNKYKHSFYYTLMNEVPQLRLQTLQHVSESDVDDDKPSYDDDGKKSTVQDYLQKIGFHTITSGNEIVGRVGFLVLEEGHKFDVNQMLTLRTESSNSKVNIPFVEHSEDDDEEDVERCADLYTTDWSEKDYYYNITGKYDPKEKVEGEEEGDTVRWGLHIQELFAGDKVFYDNLLDGAKHGTVTSSIRWMSYDHLWKGLCASDSLPDDIYSNSSDFYKYQTKYTFFSAEEPEAWWNDEEGAEVSRFDVTGYEWRNSSSDYYKQQADGKMRVRAKEGTSAFNGWDDISGDSNKIKLLAFVKDDDGTEMDSSKLPLFNSEENDEAGAPERISKSIPALADMKDKNGDSLALQVAANMVDYCDSDDNASVYPDNVRSTLISGDINSDSFKIIYCGNERVAYFNELALQFYASREFNDQDNTFVYRLWLTPFLEMANMFDEKEKLPIGDIVIRVKGTFDIECGKESESHGGADSVHPDNPTTNKDFDLVFKASDPDEDFSSGYLTNFSFDIVQNHTNLIFQYKEGYDKTEPNPDDPDGDPIFIAPQVKYTVRITNVVMISSPDDDKVYDIGWWRSADVDSADAFTMDYTFSSGYMPLDWYYYGTIEANDPRCNHRSEGWAWRKVGDKFVSGDSYIDQSNIESVEGYHTLGDADGNSNFKPDDDGNEYYGSADSMDVEKTGTKIYEISTSFIRNAPFETLWELGAIHRGEPFRTINLCIFPEDFEEDDFGKYLKGDAHILEQVKIGPARYSRGKFNVNSRSAASYVMLYDKKCFGEKDNYDNPIKASDDSSLTKPEWDFKDAEPNINRGQIANLISNLSDYENDRQMESFIGRTANLLTTRNEAYTIIVISQALQERKDLKDAMEKAGMSDAQQKELIKTNMTNPTWYKVYEDADTSNVHLCEILGTNVIMAHVVRDAWTGKMTVVKKEYLNNSK